MYQMVSSVQKPCLGRGGQSPVRTPCVFRFIPRPIHVRFAVNLTTLRQIYIQVLRISPVSYHSAIASCSFAFNTTFIRRELSTKSRHFQVLENTKHKCSYTRARLCSVLKGINVFLPPARGSSRNWQDCSVVGTDGHLFVQGSGARRGGSGPRQRTRERRRRRTTPVGVSCIRPSSWAAPVSTTVRLQTTPL